MILTSAARPKGSDQLAEWYHKSRRRGRVQAGLFRTCPPQSIYPASSVAIGVLLVRMLVIVTTLDTTNIPPNTVRAPIGSPPSQ